MAENMAKPGGPMTECKVAQDKKFKDCKFFEARSRDPDNCRYCAFEEFCINIKAYFDAKNIPISVIDTVN